MILLIEYRLAVTIDFEMLMELIKLSSILRKVWSPDAPTHVALLPCLGPILGICPGIQYQGVLGLLNLDELLWPACAESSGDMEEAFLPSCPF